MARIVLAGTSEERLAQVSRVLASSGYTVFRTCLSGSELRRSINACEDGVVLLLGSVPDLRPDDLQWDYGDRIRILLVGRPEQLSSCESREIFRLELPTSVQALLGAVEMLSQLHRMNLPRRLGTDKEIVERAKEQLMRQRGITEPEAHRAMQRYAMRHGIRMAECAARVLDASADMEEQT